jgi:hypothetical protein
MNRNGRTMTTIELTGREVHVLLKALVLAVKVIERQPYYRRPESDCSDMKKLLDRLESDPAGLQVYTRSAFWILDGNVPSAEE